MGANKLDGIFKNRIVICGICFLIGILTAGFIFSNDTEINNLKVQNDKIVKKLQNDISEQEVVIQNLQSKVDEAKPWFDQQEANNIKDEKDKKEEKISYDKLQQLYLDIKSEMSYEEILVKVVESGLPFSETKFYRSKAIKVAFEEGVTPQKYADSGDHINISFYGDDRDANYIFGTIEYFNNGKFVTIFEYRDGSYWDFRNGQDRGYYINNYQNTMGDKNEKYIKTNNKEEQLKYVMNYVKK